jgi:hypothetical protein
MTRLLRVELAESIPALRGDCDEDLLILATYSGVPIMRLHLPSIGRCLRTDALLAALVRRAVTSKITLDDAVNALEARMADLTPREPLHVSVVVCTHRRPESLAVLLAALRRLDPPPGETIVVDNAPGEMDCRELAEASGARYVREDVPGLDIARATGARTARGEVIAFTDDDVVPAVSWLKRVPELFDNPEVGCVAGPVLPLEMATAAHRKHELYATLNRGFLRREEDWTTLRAAHAPELGVGANMIFRRAALRHPERVFPPELDAGTPSRSGGDGYALYRSIVDGWSVIYDPATYVLHSHRHAERAFEQAVRGYGIGLGCWTGTILLKDRDLGALSLGLTPIPYLWQTALKYLAGETDQAELRVAWAMVQGLLESPRHLHRARRAARSRTTPAAGGTARPNGPAALTDGSETDSAAQETLSVLLIGAGAGDCQAQSLHEHPRVAEVIALPHFRDQKAVALRQTIISARGSTVLLWDSRSECRDDFIEAHARAHDGIGEHVAIGPIEAVCGDRRLSSRVRSHEVLGCAARVKAGTASALDVGEVNVSFSRALLEEHLVAGAGVGVQAIRKAALSASLAGCSLGTVPVTASREYRGTFSSLMVEQHALGRAAAELAANPSIESDLPAILRSRGQPQPYDRALSSPTATHFWGTALAVLECARMRRLWAKVVGALLERSFRSGVAATHDLRLLKDVKACVTVELRATEHIGLEALRGSLAVVRDRGRVVGTTEIGARAGSHDAAHAIVAATGPKFWADNTPDRVRSEAVEAVELPTTTILSGDPDAAALGDPLPAGVTVRALPLGLEGRGWWTAVDRAIRACTTELVALPLPHRAVTVAWIDELRLALSGSAIGMAAGVGIDDQWPAHPITLLWKSGATGADSFEPVWVDYIAVRPEAYVSAGGFDLDHCAVGHQFAPCDLLHRFLHQSGTVSWTVAPGIVRHPTGAEDGYPAAILGVIHGASVRRGTSHALGALAVRTLGLIAAAAHPIGVLRSREPIRDLLRFLHGVTTGLH